MQSALRPKLRALADASAFRARLLPELIVLTDAPRQGPFDAIVDALSAVRCWVIFRDYEMPPAARSEHALRARELCAARGIPFLVARDLELATAVRADGVHCPQQMLPNLAQWRREHPESLLCAACHDAASLLRATQLGASVALLSPVFPTRSHPNASVMGTAQLRALVQTCPQLPIYAMGGVNLQTIDELIRDCTGVAGVAGIDLASATAGGGTATLRA
jgi:thiamine-phosphate pyrophosphorylase